MKILLSGASGTIGKQLKILFEKNCPEYTLLTPTQKELDLRNFHDVTGYFDLNQPDLVICAHGRSGWRTESPDAVTAFENILMMDNIFRAKNFGSKVINFGTGAENDVKRNINSKEPKIPNDSFYGFSKRIITSLCNTYHGVYNLRIFGCFGPLESCSRFIKKNILNYLNHEPIEIFQNRRFSYIYVGDLFLIIKQIIENKSYFNAFDCVYSKEVSLLDIANIINNLSNYKVEIKILDETLGFDYLGDGLYERYFFGETVEKHFNLIGLEAGIKEMYINLI